MENVTILMICRPQGTYKWVIEDGLVVRNWGGRDEIPVEDPCTPREFMARNQENWRNNLGVAHISCAQIMTRHVNPEAEKPYSWVVDERLDKSPGEMIAETYFFTEGTKFPRVEHRVDGRIFIHTAAYEQPREIEYCPFTGTKNAGE